MRGPAQKLDAVLVATAAATALCLGFANLGALSLWHDELVHVFVAKSIVETSRAVLPSGYPQISGAFYNLLLAPFVAIWGDSESAVRALSVLLAALNVVLTYIVGRALLGRSTALIAAFLLALSPWTVAWSREARFYTLQQTLYLVAIGSSWRLMTAEDWRRRLAFGAAALASYALGCATSFHSILFLAPVGAFAFLIGIREKKARTLASLVCVGVAIAGAATLGIYRLWMTPEDVTTVFSSSSLRGELPGVALPRLLYIYWLMQNLGTGYLLLACLGGAAMLLNEGRRGLFVVLAFWLPIVILTYFIGYRWPRFMFFAFPFYVASFSHGWVQLARFGHTLLAGAGRAARTWAGLWTVLLLPSLIAGQGDPALTRRMWIVPSVVVVIACLAWSWRQYIVRWPWARSFVAALVAVFAVRMAESTVRLTGDSLKTAMGAPLTLSTLHQQWREPCLYVRDHSDGGAVLTTTYLPALYYVRRVDNWYPSRYLPWEKAESGLEGLKTLDDLKAFVTAHPRGFFIADRARFHKRKDSLTPDQEWVAQNMKLIAEASNDTVVVYSWGL